MKVFVKHSKPEEVERMRAKVGFEEVDGREYYRYRNPSKGRYDCCTADLVNDKKIEGIANIRDESDRNGMRIVYILKRDATKCSFKHAI
jgi:DNA gyrase subunit A